MLLLSSAAADLIWLKNLLNDLLITCETPVTLYEDNQSCIHLLNKWEHRRLKHLDVKYHFVRDLVQQKIIEVKYVPSTSQKADILTKGLSKNLFEKFRSKIGVEHC